RTMSRRRNGRRLANRNLSLRSVFVGPFDIFCDGDRIVRQSVFVDAVAVRVADLLVPWAVAFDGAFVDVGIVLLLDGHHGHAGLLPSRVACIWSGYGPPNRSRTREWLSCPPYIIA